MYKREQSCVNYSLLCVFRLHPTYVHAMNNLGNILKERNELIEAEQLLSKAVSIQYVFQSKGALTLTHTHTNDNFISVIPAVKRLEKASIDSVASF